MSLKVVVYFDESGDLGWNLNLPYRAGGSSRFLTIAFLMSPAALSKHPKRLVREFFTSHGLPATRELKGKDLKTGQLLDFAERVLRLHSAWPDIRLRAITVRKENVQAHIRADANKLYNYMLKLALVEEIEHEPSVTLVPDPRSIKVASGNSMLDYLQTTLWMERGSTTMLRQQAVESHRSLALQFIDVIGYMVWRHHEDKLSDCYTKLGAAIQSRHLFF